MGTVAQKDTFSIFEYDIGRFADGKWKLSPAYDLVYSEGQGFGGEHATAVDGEALNPGDDNILKVAKKTALNLKLASKILDKVKNALK
ncbi:hypothetical protein [Endomicrobium proavitum]|uniref:Uncharacterized protein n=1 Tax=Endomicrobium proavitum TaxID=1408281 RepID=A0A0G3WJG1_9BACT|nr:hypothetical protein [Endomicrobium proavitum]AKL97992.1 hypothetical protein Epro_0613 [Endomicrobium proavitum]